MIVYLLTNKINGKYYVGQTTRTWTLRWRLHRSQAKRGQESVVCSAIRKYGENTFEVQILSTATTQEQLDQLEQLWIILLDSQNPSIGYNRALGGKGGKPMLGRKFSAEHRKHLSESRIGIEFSHEHLEKLSKAHLKNPTRYWLGKHISQATKDRLAEAARLQNQARGKDGRFCG